jgi:hypothetical protein
MSLERGPLSLVSTTEELHDRKVAAPVYKTENTAVGIRHADHVAPSIRKKLSLTSPTSDGRSVGIVRSQTQTTEFVCFCLFISNVNVGINIYFYLILQKPVLALFSIARHDSVGWNCGSDIFVDLLLSSVLTIAQH